jgi:diguanylate cyclase (GGDEF)-like protein
VPFVHGRWIGLAPTFGAFLCFHLALWVKPRRSYAQVWSLLAAAGGCVCVTVALRWGDPHHLADLALLALPVVSIGARYPRRVMGAFATFVGALLVGATLLDAGAVDGQPLRIALPLLVIATTALFSRAVRDAERHYRAEALLDPLTGLFGRRALALRATELDQQHRLRGERLAALVVDIDRFKSVNDEHGHELGDQVLKELAARLRSAAPEPGLAFRLGGEEFAILIPGADRQLAQTLGQEVAAAVRGSPVCGLPLTASIGVAARHAGVTGSVHTLLARADAALYEAKRAGRDRVMLAREQPWSALAPVAAMPEPERGLAERTASRLTTEASEPPASEFAPSWLARDPAEHERFLDMNRRMRPVLIRTQLVAVVMLVPCSRGWRTRPPRSRSCFPPSSASRSS